MVFKFRLDFFMKILRRRNRNTYVLRVEHERVTRVTRTCHGFSEQAFFSIKFHVLPTIIDRMEIKS